MMKSWFKLLIGGAVFVGLASCGPLQESNKTASTFVDLFQNVGQRAIGNDSPAPAAAPTLSRAFIDAQETELLRVSIISREATGLIGLGGRNGSIETWFSPEGLSFSFDEGLLVGTRGFGDDLMGADVSGAISSFNGGGNHLRIQDFLNGLGQIERRSFRCETVATKREEITIVERSYQTTVFEEACSGETGDFKNTYWRDSQGVIWQSRQWISDDVGFMGYQRL